MFTSQSESSRVTGMVFQSSTITNHGTTTTLAIWSTSVCFSSPAFFQPLVRFSYGGWATLSRYPSLFLHFLSMWWILLAAPPWLWLHECIHSWGNTIYFWVWIKKSMLYKKFLFLDISSFQFQNCLLDNSTLLSHMCWRLWFYSFSGGAKILLSILPSGFPCD